MTSSIVVITGASRGMGAAMAEQLLQPGRVVLGLSRGTNAALDKAAWARGATLEQWPRDLVQPVRVADELEGWLRRFDAAHFDEAVLINNAAAVTVGPVDAMDNEALSGAMRLGLEAVVLLTASFLRATRAWRAMREGGVKVLNISSGLGRRAMAGSAPYCAVKAGMDNFTRALALDEAHRGHGARVVSLAPGVIDTDMQAQLRGADSEGFPDQANFVQMQRTGQLLSPHDAAARVLSYLQRADFGTNPLADVRDA